LRFKEAYRKGMNMKNKHGFTLVEAAGTLAIIGILAMLTVKTSQNMYAQSQLQAAALNLLAELKSTKAVALKYDAQVKVKFARDSSRCSLWVDTVSDNTREPKELLRVYKNPSGVVFGKANGGPTAAPTTAMPFDAGGVAGIWKDSIMTISNNALGTICDTGAIYLKSTKLDNINYCIGNTKAKKSLQLYKYGGTTWKKL
jgi:type II secretory pathway pseudopilin PulG